MNLLTTEQYRRLLTNGEWNKSRLARQEDPDDFRPIVRLFRPWSTATWLLSELDPDVPNIAFGLCDLGHGIPALGSVNLNELIAVRGPGGLTIERDRRFRPIKTLRAYAEDARRRGRIIT